MLRMGRPPRAGGDPHRGGRQGVLHGRRRQAAGRDRRLRPHRRRACSRSSGLHRLIRDIPKPVIAAVNGYAIGGGHVLHVLCDLSIAAETARFGQAGPRVGSFDAGFGSAYLARVVGEKGARDVVPVQALRRGHRRALGPRERGRPGRPADGRGEGVGRGDRREEPDGDAVPQAVVQRRHRPPGGAVQPRDVRARPLRGVPRGHGGGETRSRRSAARLRRPRPGGGSDDGEAGREDRDRHRGRAGHRPGHRGEARRGGRHRRGDGRQRGHGEGDRGGDRRGRDRVRRHVARGRSRRWWRRCAASSAGSTCS